MYLSHIYSFVRTPQTPHCKRLKNKLSLNCHNTFTILFVVRLSLYPQFPWKLYPIIHHFYPQCLVIFPSCNTLQHPYWIFKKHENETENKQFFGNLQSACHSVGSASISLHLLSFSIKAVRNSFSVKIINVNCSEDVMSLFVGIILHKIGFIRGRGKQLVHAKKHTFFFIEKGGGERRNNPHQTLPNPKPFTQTSLYPDPKFHGHST